MKKHLREVLLTVFGVLLISCSSTTIEEDMVGDDDLGDETTLVTYDKDAKSIINNNCATSSCHGNTSAPSGGLLLTTYTLVKGAVENNGLVERMNSSTNPMPASGLLDQETRAIIDQWVIDGLLEK